MIEALDPAERRVRVMTIAPGLSDTPLLTTARDDARAALATTAFPPARKPREYAARVVHAVENPMLNGNASRLDGAHQMAPGGVAA